MYCRRLLLILVSSILLAACGERDAALLLDPYLQLSVPSVPVLVECAENSADHAGIRIRTAPVEFGADPLEGVVRAVQEADEESIILGPLFAGESGSLSQLFPDRRFVFLAAGEPEREDGDRIWFLPLDRRRAFRAAGRAAAGLLPAPGGDDPVTGDAASAAAFFFSGTPGRAAELEAFLDGYRSAGGAETLRVVEIDSLSGQESVRTAYREIQIGNPGFLVAFLSGLNGFLLDLSEEAAVPVITEYWEASGAYAERVLFSIEDDICAGVRNALGRLGGSEGARTVPGRIVEGPAMTRVRESDPDFPTWEKLYERE